MAKRKESAKVRITRDQRVAYHEAGHAVMSILHRVALVSVTIAPGEGTDGVSKNRPVKGFRPDLMADAKTRDMVERNIKILNAGHWAEYEFTGRNDWKGSLDDRQKASFLAATQCGDHDEVFAYVEWLWIATRNEIRMEYVWVAIVALAKALVEERTISGVRVRKIIKQAVPWYPWGRRRP